MKYSTNSLAGKLILFFGIMTLGIIAFALYLAWGTGQIRHAGRQLEQVYFPLTETLESLETNLDRHSYALKQASVEKKALKEHASEWATLINPQLKFVRDKIPLALDRLTTTTDSLMEDINLYQEQERVITNWINANYVNASMDSAFLASLPSREQSEFVPLVNGLESIQRQYKNHIDRLKSGVDERLHQYTDRVTQISDRMRWIGVGIAILILALVIGAGMWLIKKFYTSVSVSSSILEHLVRGEVSDYVEPSADELGVIVASANKLSDNLKQYSSFAQSIGDGSVDFKFKPVSDGDVLGNSLVQMKQKLKAINEEDKKRSWVTEGLATFADIMRRSDDYEELASLIVSELVKYTKSNQGGLFILNHDDDKDPYLQLIACYAFERKKYLQKRVDIGEGLVGQSYQERRTIYLKEIPSDYVTITSGLGGSNPSSLLLVPLKVNEIIEGVIEMASFREYQPHEIEFVEKVGEIVASTISNARINSRTRRLLEESQQHSEELRAQEEEMRQNMEEMQATQEQMQRQAEEMRKMHDKLDLERSMFQVLMEYLPDRITYKDRESRILRVNKAKAVRFKVSAEEMIGKTDYDYFAKDHADKAFQEEQDLLRLGEPKLNIEEKAVITDGDVVWASTSRIPFKNTSGEIVGMFIITKDVTELRMAEASIRDR
ncbi:MAG TPA: PAS domain S-box protein, partial [Cyclobacteriaceae bacterium]|nr:PAS domain S-box protein [Cyclobacteriaceae bacterium]